MMNKKIICLVFLLLFIGLIPLQGQGIIFKKDIFVEKGETLDNAVSWGGEIRIEGTVTDSVINFGGTIIISGEVENAVVGFGTDIILHPTARIEGDVVSGSNTQPEGSRTMITPDERIVWVLPGASGIETEYRFTTSLQVDNPLDI